MGISLAFPVNEGLGLLLLALSTPHLLYFFTWTCTGAFTRIAKAVGVEAFALFYKLSVLLKFVQLGALVTWGMQYMPPMKVASIPPLQVVVGLGMFGAGQILNMGVYTALGKEGVYYGVRLGKPIAWYEGFPFTVVPHPQYVGCVLCIWGVVAVLLNQANIDAGLLTIASAWSTFYCVTGLIEHHF